MTGEDAEDDRSEAEQLSGTLKQLNELLASGRLAPALSNDASTLRRKVSEVLTNINTDLRELAEIERHDFYKNDPALGHKRRVLIRDIESAKIAFEFDILPPLERLTKKVIEQTKQNPSASVDVNLFPPGPHGERWTIQRAIDTAQQLLDEAMETAGVMTKAYTFAKAIGLLVGIPMP